MRNKDNMLSAFSSMSANNSYVEKTASLISTDTSDIQKSIDDAEQTATDLFKFANAMLQEPVSATESIASTIEGKLAKMAEESEEVEVKEVENEGAPETEAENKEEVDGEPETEAENKEEVDGEQEEKLDDSLDELEDILTNLPEEKQDAVISEAFQMAEDKLNEQGITTEDVVNSEIEDEVLASQMNEAIEKIAAVYDKPKYRVATELLHSYKEKLLGMM